MQKLFDFNQFLIVFFYCEIRTLVQSSISSNILSEDNCNFSSLAYSYNLTSSDMELAMPLNYKSNENSYTDSNYKSIETSTPKDKNNIPSTSFLNNSVTSLSPIETVNKKNNSNLTEKNDTTMEINITRRRIVNLLHLFNEIKNLDNHELFNCGFKLQVLYSF